MPKIEKQKYRHGRRLCIFCNGDGKISKEHVFAEWLRDYFPRYSERTHKSAFISWMDESGPSAPVDRRSKHQGHLGTKKLRVVCSTCNGGWMSNLEGCAKSALPPLMAGQRCNITEGGQKLLATWAAKTAMVAERLLPETDITQPERAWLMDHQCPPDNWYVWISAYQGRDWRELGILQSRVGLSETPVSRPSEAPYYGQATTFVVGHVLFCVVSGSSPYLKEVLPGRDANGLIQIWPQLAPRLILWPPATVFGDEEAYAISDFFGKSGFFDSSLSPGANWTYAH